MAYGWTPHEEIWHEVLYSLLCVPIFCFWLIALFGCIISFLSYLSTAGPQGSSSRRPRYASESLPGGGLLGG